MNTNDLIFLSLFAISIGWFIAYLVRNIGYIYYRWGDVIGFFILYISFFITLSLARSIANEDNILISALFGISFLIRFFKQPLEKQ
jgi:hypothetical protein